MSDVGIFLLGFASALVVAIGAIVALGSTSGARLQTSRDPKPNPPGNARRGGRRAPLYPAKPFPPPPYMRRPSDPDAPNPQLITEIERKPPRPDPALRNPIYPDA